MKNNEQNKINTTGNGKNVLLITYDALRPDYLGCYGYEEHISPNIDEIASDGVLFKNAIANGPNTFSSMPALLTSTYPFMYGGYSRLTQKRTLISEVLSQRGYRTAGIHCNPYLSSFFGYNRGFEIFHWKTKKGGTSFLSSIQDRILDTFSEESGYYPILRKLESKFGGLSRRAGRLTEKALAYFGINYLPEYVRAEELTDLAISWLNSRKKSENFFLWIHYLDSHAPYNPPPEFLSEIGVTPPSKEKIASLYHKQLGGLLNQKEVPLLKSLYLGEIRYMDHETGRLIGALKEEDQLEDTVVILTADHGEEFGEHGNFGHKAKLYDEVLRVPLILTDHGVEHEVVDTQVQLLDISPTICDLLEISAPSSFQGESFYPLIREKVGYDSKIVISEVKPDHVTKSNVKRRSISVRTGRWKYIFNEKGEDELYDLKEDPNEKFNLRKEKEELTRLLKKRILLHWRNEVKYTPLKREIGHRVSRFKDGMGKVSR